jgi:DamX protein
MDKELLLEQIKRAPWLFAVAATSFILLFLCIGLLLGHDQPTVMTEAETETAAMPEHISFPQGFGMLADLVPFAGGVAPASPDVVPAAPNYSAPAPAGGAAAATPAAVGGVPVPHALEFRGDVWLSAQNSDNYTLQVMAARDEEVVKRFLAQQANRAAFAYFKQVRDGADWYVVITGSYPSIEQARAAAQDFGAGSKPFPKKMGDYQ